MRSVLKAALQSRFEGLGAINVYYGELPDRVTYPYLVWWGINEVDEPDSMNKHEMDDIQVDIVAEYVDTVIDLGETVKDAMNWETLTVSGWTNIRVIPLLVIPAQRFGDVWQETRNYQTWIYKAR